MPTRKIKDHEIPCQHPEHDPPRFMAFEPGEYEHTCPACGHKTYFTVPLVYMKTYKGARDYDPKWTLGKRFMAML